MEETQEVEKISTSASQPFFPHKFIQGFQIEVESRLMIDRTDWKLNPVIFQQINQLFGPLVVDLFAMRLIVQCPLYFSWWPDPSATATDAFLQSWTGLKAYANHPWNLIGRVLAQVQSQQSKIVLVAPVWRAQPWFPMLLGILIDYPRQMPSGVETTFNLQFMEDKTNHMTTSLGNGTAGALNGIMIPFQDL